MRFLGFEVISEVIRLFCEVIRFLGCNVFVNVFVKREQRKLACSAERRKGRMKSKGLFPDYLEQSM